MPLPRSAVSPPLDPTRAFAARAAGIPGSPIDRSIGLLRSEHADFVSFAIGAPAPAAIPAAELRAIAGDLLADDGALNYGPTEGEAELRATLLEQRPARRLRQRGGLLVTAGAPGHRSRLQAVRRSRRPRHRGVPDLCQRRRHRHQL
jgi:DNA-binding transcriptional MocR family regulator